MMTMTRTIGSGVALGWLTLMGIGGPASPARAEPTPSTPPETVQSDAPTVAEAQALQGAGQWEEAAEAWGRIVKQDPDNAAAWFNLGYSLHAAGRLEEAIKAHKKAASFDQYRDIAQYNLGCAYALAGRPDEAFEALAGAQAAGWSLREYVGQDSDLDSLLEDPRLGELLAREPAGRWARVQQALARALQYMDQQAPQAKQQLAAIMQQVSRQAQMWLGQLQQEMAKDPRLAGYAQKIQGWLGGGHAHTGEQHDEAGDVQLTGPQAESAALAEKAQRHQQAGEWAEAAAAYTALMDYHPDNSGLCFALAYSLLMAGDYEKAIEANKKAATFDETRPISLYNLACAYALTGRTDEALKALKESREAGFNLAASLPTDSDLDSLRDDPRFKEFLADVTDNPGS
jgi:Flp pilus assembly protein TadD